MNNKIKILMLVLMTTLYNVSYSMTVGTITLSCRDFYLKGCSIPIKISYTVGDINYFDLDTVTLLPFFVEEELLDKKGQEIRRRGDHILDEPYPVISNLVPFSLKKDTSVVFTRDISKQCETIDAGEYEYILYAEYNEKKNILAKATIKIVNTLQQNKYVNDDIKMIDISIVKVDDEKLGNWYLKCNQIGSNNFIYYDVPVDTKIKNVLVDFNVNIWIVLENNKKYELLLWNNKIKEYQLLISWGEKDINLGTTKISSKSLPFVFAGREGEPWFTSSSISPLHTTYIE